MPDVVLFQPALGYWEYFVRDVPISLLAVARGLVDRYTVEIVDGRVPGWQHRLRAALAKRPLCLGVTVKTGRPITYALEAAAIAREVAPATPVVWGGVHPSLLPEETLRHPWVDVLVAGEAEESFAELVDALARGGADLDAIPGLWLRDGGGTAYSTGKRRPLALSTLPVLPYQLVRFADYEGRSALGEVRAAFFETGRGCPWTCHYCYNDAFHGATWRPLKAEAIAAGISHLRRYWDVRTLYFVDDSFFTDPRRARSIAALFSNERIDVRWRCEGCTHDIARLSDDDLARLRAAGCEWIAMGVETGSARLRERYEKRLDVGELHDVNRRLGRAGIRVNFNIMTGFLGEERADLRDTTRLALSLLRENPSSTVQSFQAAVPYPGTAYSEAVRTAGYGDAIPTRLEGWQDMNPEDWMRSVPWLDRRRRNLLRTLFLASLFVDGKVADRSGTGLGSLWLRLLGWLYRPVARWRIASLVGALPVEALLFDALLNRRYLRASDRAATQRAPLPPAGPSVGHLTGLGWVPPAAAPVEGEPLGAA